MKNEPVWTPEEKAKVAGYLANGCSFNQIATYMHCTRLAAIGRCKRAGLVSLNGHVLPKLIKRLNADKFAKFVTVISEPVAFADLNLDKQCRYPYEPGFYCGLPQHRKSLCAEHAARCYAPAVEDV